MTTANLGTTAAAAAANEFVAPRQPVAIARAGYGDDLPEGAPLMGMPRISWEEVTAARWQVAADDNPTVRIYYDNDGEFDGWLTVYFVDATAAAEGDWDAIDRARFDTRRDTVMYEWEW